MIILLSGHVGAGKDFVADILASDMGFTKLSFADELKKQTSIEYGLDITYFHDRKLKDRHIDHLNATPRQLMMKHADLMKSTNINCFVDLVINQFEPNGHYVISDLRYHHELKKIRDRPSLVTALWIDRKVQCITEDGSEINANDCNWKIDNNCDSSETHIHDQLDDLF